MLGLVGQRRFGVAHAGGAGAEGDTDSVRTETLAQPFDSGADLLDSRQQQSVVAAGVD
ncbi:hypothetical protein [Methylomonas koyamae]|uniref:hypothetical protein n=1 Tax=Methylomonas koyamae TaxID=702114 RepID=UPI00210F50C5|nr:hypothetical protein [Methylomonas koyamae]